jgi:hypothetical protein
MTNPMSESEFDALRVEFDGHLMFEFCGSVVISDAGLLP